MLRRIVFASMIAFSATAAILPAIADKNPGEGRAKKWDPAKHEEMRQKHQEELHTKLKLSAEQESAWQTFVSKTKMTPPQHNKGDWEAMKKMTAPERMEKMLDQMKTREAKMQDHLNALKEFYGQLTPEQRTTFDQNIPHHRGHGGHGGKGNGKRADRGQTK